MVFCPECYSNLVKKNGFDRKKVQKYRCTSCGRQFTAAKGAALPKMRYPRDIIKYALVSHYRDKKTFREVAEALQKKGVDVSYVAVYGWAKKFATSFAKALKNFRPYSSTWRVDGKYVRIKGKRQYLWSVYDSNGNIVSIQLTPRRTKKQMENAIRGGIKTVGFKPTAIHGLGFRGTRKTVPGRG